MNPFQDQYSNANVAWIVMSMLALLCLANGEAPSAETVILRNLTRLENVSVIDFGDDHIALSNGTLLAWDEILSGTLVSDRADDQASFDLRIKTHGLDLARLKLRLANRDLNGAASIATKLLAGRIDNITSILINSTEDEPNEIPLEQQATIAQLTHDTNFLIGSLAFDHYLKMGEREAALVAFIVATDHQRFASDDWKTRLNALRSPNVNETDRADTFFDTRLQPIWFDNEALGIAYRQIGHYFGQSRLRLSDPFSNEENEEKGSSKTAPSLLTLPPGVEVYLASMEIQQIQPIDPSLATIQKSSIAARLRRAKNLTEGMTRSAHREELLLIIEIVEDHLASLPNTESSIRNLSQMHPLAIYLRNSHVTAKLEDNRRMAISDSTSVDKLLELLSIAANDGSRYPHLASAAIAKVIDFAKSVGDEATERKLRYELMQKYPFTYHARQFDR